MKYTLLCFMMMIAVINSYSQVSPQSLDLTGCSCNVTTIDAVSPDVVWVGTQTANFGASTTFGRTTDGGTTWTTGNLPSTIVFFGITAVDDQNAWAACHQPSSEGGEIWHTSDGGANWTKQTTTEYSGGFLNTIHFFSSTEGVALGDANGGYWEIYTTSDGGTTWTRVSQSDIPDPLNGEGAHPNYTEAGDNIWFGSNMGRIFHSTDKGHTWTVSSVSSIECIPYFIDALNGVANTPFTTNSPVYTTADGGANWSSASAASNFNPSFCTPVEGSTASYIFTGGAPFGSPQKLYYTNNNFESFALIDNVHSFNSYLTFSGATSGWISNSVLGASQGIFKYSSAFPIGIDDVLAEDEIQVTIFPNPASDFAELNISSSPNEKLQVRIIDAVGRVVYQNNFHQPQPLTMNLESLVPGIYLVRIQSESNHTEQKLVIE